MTAARFLGAAAGVATVGVATAGVATAAYATFAEPRWFALRRVTAPVLRGAATGTPHLRLLHLSDLHLQPRYGGLAAFLERCAAEDPDLVVVTGDMLGHPSAVRPAVDLLARFGDRGVFVLGSNDRFAPTAKNPLRYFRRRRSSLPSGEPLDTGGLVTGLTAAGWRCLENRRARVDTPAGPVEVFGVGDAHMHADRLDDLDWSPPGDDAVLALGVTHAPYLRLLDHMARSGLDLAVAGHTHGGQVRLPGVGALVNNCDLPLRRSRGLSEHAGGLLLHVSAGLGASRFSPFRFACRPEATLLTLVPRVPVAATIGSPDASEPSF